MNPNITLAYAMFTILLVPLGGAALLIVSARLRKRHRPRVLAVTRLLLSLMAVAMILVSAGGLIAIIGWGLHSRGGNATLIPSLLADSMMMLLLAMIGFSGVQALRLSRRARCEMSPSTLQDLEERIGLLQVIAWSLIGLPLLFVAPLLIPFCVILFMLVEGPASARRSKRGHLLWLLAIGVRRQQPLPPLLDSYADSQGGAQAFSIWRFVRFFMPSKFRTRIHNLAKRLRDGIPLPDALEDSPGLLSRSTVVAVRVGHESGCLGEALHRAAQRHSHSLQRVDTLSGIATFFIYGAAVLSATIGISVFQMLFVVPKLKQIYIDFAVELPAITISLLNTADSVTAHILLAAPIVSLPCLLLMAFGVSWFWGLDNLKIPWLIRLWPRLHSSELFRSLSLALTGHRTLGQALEVQIDAAHHPEVAIRLERVRQVIVSGGSGWAALRQERLINDRELAVLECSQRLGNLPWALELMAESSERRLHRRVLWCYQAVRPVVIGAIGTLVGFICIGFFLPLVKLLMSYS